MEITASVYETAKKSRVKYARGTHGTGSLDYPSDLFRWEPTYYHKPNWDALMSLAETFIETDYESPKLFYVVGHSYEFCEPGGWEMLEEFCRLIGNRKDVFYGTNREIAGL